MNAGPRRSWKVVLLPSGALSAGGLAAFLGACCGLPWLVAAFGVTGAIALARIAFLAPYLWALAIVLAVATFAWVYGPARAAECGVNARRYQRVFAWIVVVALIALFMATRAWRVLGLGG